MMKAKICEQWELEFDDIIAAEAQVVVDPIKKLQVDTSYFWCVIKRPWQIGLNAQCFSRICDHVEGKINCAAELFGGIGVTSTIMYHRFEPEDLLITDLDGLMIRHLRLTFPEAWIMRADTLAALPGWVEAGGLLRSLPFDMISFDYNAMTVLKSDLIRPILDMQTVRYVSITDQACVWSHRKFNLKVYGRHAGWAIESVRDYVKYWEEKVQPCNYSVVAAAYNRKAMYVLFELDKVMDEFPVYEVEGDGRAGFDLIEP